MDSINRLLRIADVTKKTTLAKSTIWLKISQGKFPKPIKLGDSINVWMESDIDSWITSNIPKPQYVENTSVRNEVPYPIYKSQNYDYSK
jgi:prophage regulatory protein